MSDRTNLHKLFADYASGEITEDQLQTLEAALRADADLRQDFIEYMNVDAALGGLAALSDDEMSQFDTAKSACLMSAKPSRTARKPLRIYTLAGAIAAVLLVATSLWIASSVPEPTATLVAEVDAALYTDGQQWEGTALPSGKYTLQRGLLHLQFGGGVMVYIEAPARFDAVSDKRIILYNGRLSASVPPAGVGFTVETPEAEVVDFGTEFSVDVENSASEVHVFDGLVRVQPRTSDNKKSQSIDLRTDQAVRIDKSRPHPVGIELATDRFIRNFDEPLQSYPRSVKNLSPVAYYRMPIRDKGLICEPPEYSGEVLTGEGERPPHAKGFIGGSLRVLAESSGRGGFVQSGPPLSTGQLTLVAVVYAESLPPGGTVVTNISDNGGNFSLTLDQAGLFKAEVRTEDGKLASCSSTSPPPLKTWYQVVVTADGDQLKLYEDGRLVASTECSMLKSADSGPIWFGTGSEAVELWDGRIDEVTLFDRAINASEVAALYEAALYEASQEQFSKSR